MAAADIKRTNHSSGHFLYEISNQFSVLKSLKDELKGEPTDRAQFKKNSLHFLSNLRRNIPCNAGVLVYDYFVLWGYKNWM